MNQGEFPFGPAERSGGDPPPKHRTRRQAHKVAKARAELGMARAAEKAERLEPGWKDAALEAVYRHALAHDHFMAEDVPIVFPPGASHTGSGAIVKRAEKLGWITPDGFAPARTSNDGPKTRWRSLLRP